MLSLAAIRYRHVLADSGGPIARVVSTPVSVYGRQSTQACAYLAPGLIQDGAGTAGAADGMGSHRTPAIAGHKAISEALERWAFCTASRGPNAQRYHFIEDRTSNGMAAFPGLFKAQAKRRSRLEALECLALISWWDGRCQAIPASPTLPGVNVLRLQHPASFGEVVLVYRKAKTGHVTYGHAADTTLARAMSRAVADLSRNEFTITCHKLNGSTSPVSCPLERRQVYFASNEGHKEFQARLHATMSKPAPVYEAAFDGELKGPWSRYATVWRTALKMPTQDYLDPTKNFFFW